MFLVFSGSAGGGGFGGAAIMSCMATFGGVSVPESELLGGFEPCPGGWTSHPVVPYYLTATDPNTTRWEFDLAHSPLLNRSTPESFDYCSYASIRVMESYAGVGTSVH